MHAGLWDRPDLTSLSVEALYITFSLGEGGGVLVLDSDSSLIHYEILITYSCGNIVTKHFMVTYLTAI